MTVKVKLSGDPERSVTGPNSKAPQGTTSPGDYSGVPANVIFAPGDTEETFTFSSAQDTFNDDGESVKLAFRSNLPAGVSEGNIDETLVSITGDDVPSVTVSFEQDPYTVAEGNSVAIKATLNADPERSVTIPLTKTGQGGATTADYSGLPQNVVFNSGDNENTLSFTAVNDTADDDGESVKLTLGSLPTGVSAGTTTETIVSITDDDDPQVSVAFEQATHTVTEGSSVTMKVKLSAYPERTVEIDIAETAQGNATAADYTGVPGSVSFNAGDTEQTFVLSRTIAKSLLTRSW